MQQRLFSRLRETLLPLCNLENFRSGRQVTGGYEYRLNQRDCVNYRPVLHEYILSGGITHHSRVRVARSLVSSTQHAISCSVLFFRGSILLRDSSIRGSARRRLAVLWIEHIRGCLQLPSISGRRLRGAWASNPFALQTLHLVAYLFFDCYDLLVTKRGAEDEQVRSRSKQHHPEY